MKDAFGGTIMLYVLLVFLAIYIIFISLTLNYAKAFKLKNKTIDIIEKYEGITTCDISESNCKNAITEINDYLKTYDKISIKPVSNKDITNTCYYEVKTYIKWEFPFLNAGGTWVINGETRNVSNCEEFSFQDERE